MSTDGAPDGRPRDERLLRDVLTDSHTISLEQMPGMVAGHAALAGLADVLIYVVDLQQQVLRLLTGKGGDAGRGSGDEPEELRVEGTLAGRAYQSVELVTAHPEEKGEAEHLWVPILDGTERIGVMRVTVEPGDAAAAATAECLAGLVALLIVSKGPSSDSLARLVRTRDMSVSAEMQWRLLPPMTFSNDAMVIGAALEPAYKLGGDTFDYGLAGDIVHLAVLDAMGHDTSAGITANLAVAAHRNSRLQGAGLVESGRAIEEVLIEQDESGRFVTAVLAELDTSTGILSWISHGHPPPVVIRGGRWVATLECEPGHPLGTDLGVEPAVCREQLEPGDRLLLYTDGIVEARDPNKEEFGLVRFVDFIIRRNADGLPVPETLRRLVHSILQHHAGRLDDDATVLLLEWRGSAGIRRAEPSLR
ncbi:PP2C family protein-serine/threonine phosphatase [Actinomadura opuntiae]|uniref:PP2C family protein-serine/threonine phosphatase n=1 Tax=Actinomadura sp. OS1-43 TaxID=604315 RepID=UPI00255B0284|nr:PP2C family protein-serine/threonine phosphatase [Actinomadura sp. OS1-43]MDL4819678.1 PP2C family protein-serine/threonine phosphatase [Actinomadura sp. OS1-43]